ncbi:MAG: phosphate signaling complex protein PhoU [Alphaproteobacteria bacterium]|nr:phosphate signaling complex protein PhoU [Alphaproteobacteria bacterium]
MDRHTFKAYDDELALLRQNIIVMGRLARAQVEMAVESLSRRDPDKAVVVITGDAVVDAHQNTVNDLTLRLLALRSPVAQDLRIVIGSLKLASELERIADLATNIAKRVLVLMQQPALSSITGIVHMGNTVIGLFDAAMEAYTQGDEVRAMEVWESDELVDGQCSALLRELMTYMLEDPRNISACSHLLFVAKNIERVGDHATNIAEVVHYIVTGESIIGSRPKRDTSSCDVTGLDTAPAQNQGLV